MKSGGAGKSGRARVFPETEWVLPSKWLPSREYAHRFKARWHAVYPAAANVRTPPLRHGSITADLQCRLDPHFPELGVLEVEGALICSKAGWVFSREGYLLPDHSWFGRHVDEMWIPAHLPRARRLKGVCLSLCSDFAVGSYGHLLLDSMSRLDLFLQAGFNLSAVDHVLCAKPVSANAQRLFDSLRIPPEKCLWCDGNVAVRPDTLLVPSFPGTRRNYPRVPEFLKRMFLPRSMRRDRRLYMSRRGGRRNAVNEEAVHRIMLAHGFEIYDPSQQADTTRDFAQAAIVVGPHGGALTDLAFCHPGTKVLELIPSDHIYPYYYTLSEAAGLEYGYLVCRSTHERAAKAWGPSGYDFHVSEQELACALDSLTAGMPCG